MWGARPTKVEPSFSLGLLKYFPLSICIPIFVQCYMPYVGLCKLALMSILAFAYSLDVVLPIFIPYRSPLVSAGDSSPKLTHW